MANRKIICPRCAASNGFRIPYEPSLRNADSPDGTIEEGFFIQGKIPTFRCLNCDYHWGGKSMALLSEMKFFGAYVGGYFGPSYSVEVDFTKGTLTYHNVEGHEVAHTYTKQLATDTHNKLVRGLVNCEFLDWIEGYSTPGVMDGTSWSVEIRLPDNQTIDKSGSNGYPGRWNQFCRMVSRISGGPFS